jgi:hypothetical protein
MPGHCPGILSCSVSRSARAHGGVSAGSSRQLWRGQLVAARRTPVSAGRDYLSADAGSRASCSGGPSAKMSWAR